MTELLTAAQMRGIERAAIESGAVTGLELMELAGRGVVEAILAEWPEMATAPQRAVVLCGPGNNGGDGFVVARLLRERGWELEVLLYGDVEKLPPDAAENARRWQAMGEIAAFPPRFSLPEDGVVIDALFGTGLTRPLEIEYAFSLNSQAEDDPLRVVAVDIPSGICADSGRPLGLTGAAHLTVTFHRAKLGHYLAQGPQAAGKVVVAPLGLPVLRHSSGTKVANAENSPASAGQRSGEKPAKAANGHSTWIETATRIDEPWPFLSKGRDGSHKYHYGHALVLAGGVGRGGAARLAARGALRVGAGLVTVGCPPAALIENAARLDAIMLRPIGDAAAVTEALQDKRIWAACAGPGLGVGEATRETILALLKADVETVLDADALTSFAEKPEALFEALHAHVILTPHAGEFARLFPDLAAKLTEPATTGPAYSKVDATREAAARAGCTILFKGADTVIAEPDGRARINSAHYDRAVPWLATAGSGDVLAGMITGLLVRGFHPTDAAASAAWLHVEAARRFGPGLIAEDLPEMLPAVLRNLAP
ncbi:MAG: NAD(P)H-hydrate dehydratase [Pseudomonadota bacterium]